MTAQTPFCALWAGGIADTESIEGKSSSSANWQPKPPDFGRIQHWVAYYPKSGGFGCETEVNSNVGVDVKLSERNRSLNYQ